MTLYRLQENPPSHFNVIRPKILLKIAIRVYSLGGRGFDTR
jgi:hypothetical protein